MTSRILDGTAALSMIAASGVIMWSVLHRPAPEISARGTDPVEDVRFVESLDVIPAGGSRGSHDAGWVVAEFTDFQCPFCARYVQETFPNVVQHFVDSGKVSYAVFNYPLDSIHPLAQGAAAAAICAGRQQKFWEMHDRLFANPARLSRADLLAGALSVGLDQTMFGQCLTDATDEVQAHRQLGTRLGVVSTPTFLVGKVEAGNIRFSKRIRGAHPYEVFREAIESAVKGAGN